MHLLYICVWQQDGRRGCFFPVGHPGRVTRSPSKSGNCLTAAFISNPHLGAAMGQGAVGAVGVRGWWCGSGCSVPSGWCWVPPAAARPRVLRSSPRCHSGRYQRWLSSRARAAGSGFGRPWQLGVVQSPEGDERGSGQLWVLIL